MFNPYNATCMYVFSANNLMLDNQLVKKQYLFNGPNICFLKPWDSLGIHIHIVLDNRIQLKIKWKLMNFHQ